MTPPFPNHYGTSLHDELIGGDGDDGFDGRGSADTMRGGKGDDWYRVDSPGDVVIENAGEGAADGVVSFLYEYNLPANVEVLLMLGGAFIGRGNDLNKTIWGTRGDNLIDGRGGADTMAGDDGNDWYWVGNPNDGVIEYAGGAVRGTADRVVSRIYEYTLAANVKELSMKGGAFIGRGNDLNNIIVGTAGNNRIDGLGGNDLIDGLAGADTMAGGGGNDHYWIDNPGDVVIENTGEGTADRVVSRLYEYNLAENVEELSMENRAFIGRGNDLDNTIWGTAGNNLIDGLGGADTMAGGDGNDYYWVDNPGDTVIENAGEGADGVLSTLYEYKLAANMEELSLQGGAIIGRGNELNNGIWGTAGNNLIDGLGGADTMRGGKGDDWYWVENPGDVVIEYAGQDAADGVVSSLYEYNLAANVEELSMEGGAFIGRGNDLDNTIWGTAGNNLIDGLGGADTMAGGDGNDHYWVENPGDVVIENTGEGTADRVVSRLYEYKLAANVEELSMENRAFIGRGNDLDNTIWGTAGNNLIDGLGGADTMVGGAGNDYYWVDNPGDTVIENAGEGADGVLSSLYEYKLAANMEELSLQGGAIIGRGNELNNGIWGTAGNNLIDGLGGADTMRGGKGDDWYWVENPGDVVIEYAGQDAADGVVSSLYEYNLAANVEELSMEGGAFIGRGNDLNNIIVGTAGNNLIDGLGGADTMVGDGGNDHYWVDNPADVVIEYAGEGTADRVVSRIYEYKLAANVEELSMENGAYIGRGNDLNNTIWGTAGDNLIEGLGGNDLVYGGDGADTLWGGLGDDTIWGGTGSDTYLFALGDGADRIVDDSGSTDVLQFQGSISADQIWLRQLGNDLEASVIGTSDKITIENWHAGNQYHVEQIKSSDGRTLLEGSVNNLVQAMAAFAPPGPGQTSLPASYATALAPVIAASWF